jgi:hypothetical protein
MQFSDVLGINRKPSFEEFQLFLQTMEVYGSGYDADVDYLKYNMRASESHSEAMIKQLDKVIYLYELALVSIDMHKRDSLLGAIPTFHSQIQSFLTF